MIRLDQALVERGLCDSRERAKRLILAGQARVNAQTARKPLARSARVSAEAFQQAPGQDGVMKTRLR